MWCCFVLDFFWVFGLFVLFVFFVVFFLGGGEGAGLGHVCNLMKLNQATLIQWALEDKKEILDKWFSS